MTTMCHKSYQLSADNCCFCRFTMTDLTAEVKELKTSVEELKKNLKNCPTDVQNQLKKFAQVKVETTRQSSVT